MVCCVELIFKGLVKGEAIRFLRSNTDAHTYYNTFRKHLLRRNDPRRFFDSILRNITYDLRASYIPNLSPTPNPSPSPNPASNIPRHITTYSAYYTSLSRLYWSPIHNEPPLSILFPTPPQLCFQRNAIIADSLVKAALPGAPRPPTGQVPPILIPRLDSRMVRCANKRCKVCPNAEGRRILFSAVSKTPYTFHETLTCTDTSLIYCIVCSKCENST